MQSKNPGPFWLTIDIMFDDAEAYRGLRVNRDAIARTAATVRDLSGILITAKR